MGISYDQAVSALYQAPFESFVAERKRIAAALKADGDKPGAAQLVKLARPTISAWAVNQLWWHAREAFDELFDTAAELRRGKLVASAVHRKALAKLGSRAQQLLSEAGHSANDATLRRVTMTLSALAAAGGFEPDTPGALSKDRDPPGFEAFGITSSSDEPLEDAIAQALPRRDATERKRDADSDASERERKDEAAQRQRQAEAEAEAEAERKREAEAAREAEAKRKARRKQLEHDLREAKSAVAEREREYDRVERELAKARHELEQARARLEAAETALETA